MASILSPTSGLAGALHRPRFSLVCPNTLYDAANMANQTGSSAVYRRKVAKAAQNVYSQDDAREVSNANLPWLHAIEAFANPPRAQPSAPDLSAAVPEPAVLGASPVLVEHDRTVTDWTLKRRHAHELALSLLLRTRNMHIMPFNIACLGMTALFSGMKTAMWDLLSSMYVLPSKVWILDFCKDVSAQLLEAAPGTSSELRIACFDNCSYPFHTAHQHVNRNGFLKHTVNWFTVPVPAERFPTGTVARGAWHDGSSRFATRHRFDPRRLEVRNFKQEQWTGFIGMALDGEDILRRPAYHAPASRIHIRRPVNNVSTAAYADVDTTTTRISNEILSGAEMVLLVGDQQSYARLFWLKKYHPEVNDWFVPLPGEWHFTAHALMAIHSLWDKCFTRTFVVELGFEETVKPSWKLISLFVYYDRFYQLLIVGLVEYLADVVPDGVLMQPHMLRQAVQANVSAVYALDFLFDFGLPWLALRHGVRANRHAVIDIMWEVTFHWFRATKKTNYSLLSVYATFFRHGMKPELQKIWTDMRTIRLREDSVSNSAYDLGAVREKHRHGQARLHLRINGTKSLTRLLCLVCVCVCVVLSRCGTGEGQQVRQAVLRQEPDRPAD
jgi:hypothetical protein